MVTFVKRNAKKVSKNLKEMIDYTLKAYKEDAKSVTVQDFRNLISDIKADLAEPTPQASATSKKTTTTKKATKKAETSTKSTKEEKPKKTKKATKKKKTISGVEPINTKGEAFDIAEVFKDEVETPLGTIVKDDSVKKIQDVAKLLDEGTEVFCAVYWTERHLEQFDYAVIPGIEQPKSFDNDLDLVSIIFVAPDNSLMIGVSSYTFVPYVFAKNSMKQHKGIRYNNGAEFNVYTMQESDDEE